MKLTPREPTPEMISKARRVDGIDALVAATAWRAMHDAAPSGWQPIETAPKDGSTFIGWNGRWRGVARYFEPHYDEDPIWTDEHTEYIVPPLTLWMPLPAPPSEKGE